MSLRYVLNASFFIALLIPFSFMMMACASSEPHAQNDDSEASRPAYSIALHGGAGAISRDVSDEVKQQYLVSLDAALQLGQDMLEDDAEALDVVEAVVRQLENDPLFNAGKGAVMTNAETFELDASIMDGRDLSAGAVAGVTTVRHPITLARKVKQHSRHVLFAGEGAERFADMMEVERVEQSYFYTERRHNQLKRAQQQDAVLLDHSGDDPHATINDNKMGTVGVAVLDGNGNLAAGTSTGGMTNKRFGRVGDSPIHGAGTYANNVTCAISSTGTGEEFIRHAVAFQISAIMEYTGASINEAAEQVIFEKLQPGDGGIIGVSHTGEIAMVFSSPGMFRAAADANGRYEVSIWDEIEISARQ